MIYLFTGLPGASKTLNTIYHVVKSYDNKERQNFYCNIRNFVLDYDFLCTFSGFFYGTYLLNLNDKDKKKISRKVSQIHDEGRNVDQSDFPHLKNAFDAYNPLDAFDYWVNRLYDKKQLVDYHQTREFLKDSDQWDFDLVRSFNLHWQHFEDPNEWYLLPKKSRILIDEIQEFFPPRSAGSKKPLAISELETHRHKGFDLFFITQDGMLVDVNIRRLVGRHTNFFNYLGGKRLTKISGSKYFDPNDYNQVRNLEKKSIKHPVDFYGSYYSAEIHTHKFKFPKFAFYGVFAVIVFLGCAFYFYNTMFSDDPLTSDSSSHSVVESSVSSSGSGSPSGSVSPSGSGSPSGSSSVDSYLDGILKDVYIVGHSMAKKGLYVRHDYVFYSNDKKVSFYPKNVGLQVIALSSCSAKLVVGSYSRFVTCDPFGEPDSFDDNGESQVSNDSSRTVRRNHS